MVHVHDRTMDVVFIKSRLCRATHDCLNLYWHLPAYFAQSLILDLYSFGSASTVHRFQVKPVSANLCLQTFVCKPVSATKPFVCQPI